MLFLILTFLPLYHIFSIDLVSNYPYYFKNNFIIKIYLNSWLNNNIIS